MRITPPKKDGFDNFRQERAETKRSVRRAHNLSLVARGAFVQGLYV